MHSGSFCASSAALFEHGVFEQLQIHIIADGHHMTGLLRTQKIARTTNFKVAHGDFKAGAEFRVFADGVEPLFRDLGQHFPLAERQIRIGVAARTAHAAANLVQLRKAQPVSVLNDERG